MSRNLILRFPQFRPSAGGPGAGEGGGDFALELEVTASGYKITSGGGGFDTELQVLAEGYKLSSFGDDVAFTLDVSTAGTKIGHGGGSFALELDVVAAGEPVANDIEYVGGKIIPFNGDNTFSLDSLTGGIDTEPSEDDFVIVAIGQGCEASQISAPSVVSSGWTSRVDISSTDSEDTRLNVWTKHMGASPDANIQINMDDNRPGAVISIRVYRNVDQTTPMDVAVTTATGGNSSLADPPAITPSSDGSWIVCFGASGHDETTDPSYVAGYLDDFHTDSEGPSTFYIYAYSGCLGVGDYRAWASGAYNPAAWTWSGATSDSGNSWAAATMALRRAA